jgi:hypothetical protein
MGRRDSQLVLTQPRYQNDPVRARWPKQEQTLWSKAKVRALLWVCALATLLIVGLALPCHAVPVFARQTGLSCIDCHSVWPVLTSDGRLFKTRGYTQTAMDGNTHIPLAVRVTTSAASETARAVNASSTTRELNVPEEINLFTGGALSDKVGAFVEITSARDADHSYSIGADQIKLAYNLNNDHPASFVLLKSNVFGADPFSGLGGIDRLPFQSDDLKPGFMADGSLLATQSVDSYSAIVHGYLGPKDRLYGAAGITTGGLVPNSDYGFARVTSNGVKYYGRLAYEMPVGDGGSWYLGGAVLTGSQRAYHHLSSGTEAYVGSVSRGYLDTGLQLPFGTPRLRDAAPDPRVPAGAPHIVEIVGLVGLGGDHGVRSIDSGSGLLGPAMSSPVGGVYAQADVFFNRTIGPSVSYESSTVGSTTTHATGLGFAWLPQLDLKVGVNAKLAHDNQGSHTTLLGLFVTKYFWVPLPPEKADEPTSSGLPKSTPSTPTPTPTTHQVPATSTPSHPSP